jgi:transcriptional regulator with XRE-family HTH domain
MPKGKRGEVGRYVALRIRQQRVLSGLTQSQLAERLGLTYQQVSKYEAGKNGVSVDRLAEIAAVLGCELIDFLPVAAPAPKGDD